MSVKLVKTGEYLVVYADNRFEAVHAARTLAMRGAAILSPVQRLGTRWVVTVEDISERANRVQVLRIGAHRMIKGNSLDAVKRKLQELITSGANLIQPLSEVTGGTDWVAIVDNADNVYKW